MSSLPPPPRHLIDRAFAEQEHVGPPWCGTAHCPICLEEEMGAAFAGPAGDDVDRAGSNRAETFLSSPAIALRAIQKLDEALPIEALVGRREYLIEAEDALGAMLGLNCTGEREGEHAYSHNGATCPIHEWLVEADQVEAQRRRDEP